MRLKAEETQLIGKWIAINKTIVVDGNTRRIQALVATDLVAVASGGDGTLYRDRHDGRLWELTYPHKEWQGGGPPSLTCVSEDDARAKYKDLAQTSS